MQIKFGKIKFTAAKSEKDAALMLATKGSMWLLRVKICLCMMMFFLIITEEQRLQRE